MRFSVIPAKAGIQSFQKLVNTLDSGFPRSDGFLRSPQFWAAFFLFSSCLLVPYALCPMPSAFFLSPLRSRAFGLAAFRSGPHPP